MNAASPATQTRNAQPRSQQARQLCRVMAGIHARGWCDGTGGNFSVVVQPPPQLQLLMAPSGVDKGRVRPGDLILVNDCGEVIDGSGRVSAEMQLHRTIVHETAAGAVLHTHSQASTLLSLEAHRSSSTSLSSGADASTITIEGLEMLKGLEGIHTHHSRVQIPVLANDQDLIRLSEAARPHLQDAPHGILIAGHGLYAWGADLVQATRHLEILEFLLEQHWRQRLWSALMQRQA